MLSLFHFPLTARRFPRATAKHRRCLLSFLLPVGSLASDFLDTPLSAGTDLRARWCDPNHGSSTACGGRSRPSQIAENSPWRIIPSSRLPADLLLIPSLKNLLDIARRIDHAQTTIVDTRSRPSPGAGSSRFRGPSPAAHWQFGYDSILPTAGGRDRGPFPPPGARPAPAQALTK